MQKNETQKELDDISEEIFETIAEGELEKERDKRYSEDITQGKVLSYSAQLTDDSKVESLKLEVETPDLFDGNETFTFSEEDIKEGNLSDFIRSYDIDIHSIDQLVETPVLLTYEDGEWKILYNPNERMQTLKNKSKDWKYQNTSKGLKFSDLIKNATALLTGLISCFIIVLPHLLYYLDKSQEAQEFSIALAVIIPTIGFILLIMVGERLMGPWDYKRISS